MGRPYRPDHRTCLGSCDVAFLGSSRMDAWPLVWHRARVQHGPALCCDKPFFLRPRFAADSSVDAVVSLGALAGMSEMQVRACVRAFCGCVGGRTMAVVCFRRKADARLRFERE